MTSPKAEKGPHETETVTAAGEQRREEILREAVVVFGESGFSGGRIDDVARRVGLRRPSILYHFDDKATLYAAALTEVVTSIADAIDATPADHEAPLEAIADTWVDFVLERPSAAHLLLRQLIDSQPEPIEAAVAPTQRLLSALDLAISRQAGRERAKSIDATEFALVLASTSLVWVSSRPAVVGALGLDTLSANAIARHRRTLHALVAQLIRANEVASEEPPRRRSATPSPARGPAQ